MKNILFTLTLLISFNLFSQSTSDLKIKFGNDLNKFFEFTTDRDYDQLFDLMNPGMFNLASKEQLAQVFEMTFDEKVSGMKFDLGTPIITGISERFDFEGYKYCMVYYSSTMKIQIVSEEYISNIENLKYVFESQYSKITDSFEFDSQTNTFTFRGLKQSMIASSQSNSDNWKYIEYKTDEQTKGMLMQIIPIEVMEKLTN